MARCVRALTATLATALALGSTSAAADTPANAATVTLNSQVVGNTAFSYLQVSEVSSHGGDAEAVPPWRVTGCRYWSQWTLVRVNAVSHERTYGVFIFDGCNHDAQVFPVPTDIRQGSCNNDDNLFPSGKFSVCPIIAEGHVPAGLPLDQRCEALTEADQSLLVDLSPTAYDTTKPTTLHLQTHFASDMAQRLSEGTCSDVLSWEAVSWTLHWSDGAVDHLPASGQQGITAAHTLKPQSQGGVQQSDVTAVARLHITGQALDFDASGNTVVRRVDGYVNVSNHDGAAGQGSAPVDEPPQLEVGAVAVGQDGAGYMAEPDDTAPPAARATTIRGRLLALWLRPIVVRPGVEMIDGAQVGTATSTVLRWRYLGEMTDAPVSEGTTPGARGDAQTPVVVQYDHAERIDTAGNPIDEEVPLQLTVRTVYPDDTVLDSTITGNVAVAIWYPSLTGTG